MKVLLESENPVTEEACKGVTGKTIREWFAVIDELGGPKAGRKAVNDKLYGEFKVDIWWVATLNHLYEKENGVVEKDGRGKGFNICVTKTLAAPIERVYEAWTRPELLSQWFGEGTTAEVVDGGTYSNADGDAGIYKRVRPNKDLRFTWENPAHEPSMVDVVFTAKGEKTYLLVNLDRVQNRPEADGLRRAWGEAIERLRLLLLMPR